MTPIVCLCGSTRFKTEFEQANQRFTREGRIVLAPGVFGHAGDPLTDEEKVRLDSLHLDKIDLAHQVFVVNPGGYIGDSTRHEIAYAMSVRKPVLYLVEPVAAEVRGTDTTEAAVESLPAPCSDECGWCGENMPPTTNERGE